MRKVDQDTRPMRRLPDSPPRISHKLRFWIFLGVGVDLGLLGLLLVIWATPVNANIPQTPANGIQAPVVSTSVAAVTLPTPVQTHSATVEPSHVAPVHRVTPTAHRSSTAPVTVPTASTPTPTHSHTPTAYPTVTPPKPSTPVPTPSESGA